MSAKFQAWARWLVIVHAGLVPGVELKNLETLTKDPLTDTMTVVYGHDAATSLSIRTFTKERVLTPVGTKLGWVVSILSKPRVFGCAER
ncbi:Molybdenum cofactor biosynthesis MoeB [Penicillium robsamsonii]|uniref:Molybdenum cofactor biosynthesis MoeB n=1 Tax=Penicillium robsamsonii TaxID=1792511 RepID=UPI0025473DFF|nr:Molybdenum cofactor biosynthesis MoeB [Penicillium robsamsonii]KAJ5823880.1 Molybdenum cofactor biosynthesis MoeB [Penicillium robsamsonii]